MDLLGDDAGGLVLSKVLVGQEILLENQLGTVDVLFFTSYFHGGGWTYTRNTNVISPNPDGAAAAPGDGVLGGDGRKLTPQAHTLGIPAVHAHLDGLQHRLAPSLASNMSILPFAVFAFAPFSSSTGGSATPFGPVAFGCGLPGAFSVATPVSITTLASLSTSPT
ncbi:hypothetical protein EYF80_004298 [Liparis tanakae]|uniref:Uncharacterized protein n=1 Tax=Liparis tanakae TaxID=230148 RepID=A0A4Z2J530_9TELE|nr:hypothetical protein EYF80_004298 [Liparis tanakae]